MMHAMPYDAFDALARSRSISGGTFEGLELVAICVYFQKRDRAVVRFLLQHRVQRCCVHLHASRKCLHACVYACQHACTFAYTYEWINAFVRNAWMHS